MIDLGNVAPLMLPWAEDAWGGGRPPVSVEAARLSAELAGTAYSMELEPWLRAGWRDATIQVDGELTPVRPQEGWLPRKIRKHRVQARLHQHGPLGQVLGTLRQVGQSDTGKALVMAHPAPDGRWVVAIGFMGTGTRFYDWISNLKMISQEGVHLGFSQLTRQFENNEDRINFPETARELGLERLTLRDILRDMQHPNSRFLLWMAGHSQGGALMQVYTHRKMREDGVLARHIVGYGFASPSVMMGTAVEQPAAYPLYHIHNGDDVVPRCGAQVHLGVCLHYPTDDALRRRCYPWPGDELSLRARARVAPILRRMTDTAACIESAVACLNVMAQSPTAEMLSALGLAESSTLGRIAAAADVDGLLRSARRHAATAYQSITGQALDQARVADFEADIREAVAAVGLRAFGTALKQMTGAPHTIAARLPGGCVGPYRYIVNEGMDRLIPTCWQAGSPPVRLLGVERTAQAHVGSGERRDVLLVRRREQAPRRSHAGLRRRDPRPRTDTRHHTPELELGAMRAGEKLIRERERKTW